MAQQGYEDDLLRRWFPEDAQGPAKRFTESDICDIAEVLTRSSRDAWSRIPRIYSILRKIGELNAINTFIDHGFTDVSFPFSGATLPEALRDHSARLKFLELQHLVYHTEALDLERQARHGHFSNPKDVPLKKVGELGKGGFGYVDRVVSTISHKEYARKLISRGKTFRKDKQVLRAFAKELSNLKGLSHRHLVKLAGSYTDRKFVAIIMLPVADMNLQTFLEKADLDDTSRSFLRPFFGCLTSALSYLHDNRIRHKDIKPSNVLIKHDQVYLTDFGTSLDWSGCDNSTTLTAPPTTPRYCAPEVMAFVERNTSSDIWSLGCVFLEMWTVLKRHTLDELKIHMSAHGSNVKEYHHNLEAVASWIQILENGTGPSCDLAPSKWIQNMLQHQPRSRWNCHILANHIQEVSTDPSSQYAFKGLCCLEPDDDTSDETESFESADEHFEFQDVTQSPPRLERNGSGKTVGLAALDISRSDSVVRTEPADTAALVSPAQPDVPDVADKQAAMDGKDFAKAISSKRYAKVRDKIERWQQGVDPNVVSKEDASASALETSTKPAASPKLKPYDNKPNWKPVHERGKSVGASLENPVVRTVAHKYHVTPAASVEDEIKSLSGEVLENPVIRTVAHKCHVTPAASVEDEIKSLSGEIYEPSISTKGPADANTGHGDTTSFVRVNNVSGSDDETPKREETNEVPPRALRQTRRPGPAYRSSPPRSITPLGATSAEPQANVPTTRRRSRWKPVYPKHHTVKRVSSSPEKARYEAAYRRRTEEEAQRRAEQRQTYQYNQYAGTEPGLLSSNADHGSHVSGTSSIKNPKTLASVEDAIKRLILPELKALKEERATLAKPHHVQREETQRGNDSDNSVVTHTGVRLPPAVRILLPTGEVSNVPVQYYQ